MIVYQIVQVWPIKKSLLLLNWFASKREPRAF